MEFSKFGEYGIIGLFCGTILFILWRMIIWVMAFVKETYAQHNQERAVWYNNYKAHCDLLLRISSSLDEHDKRADERGRYVREEHKEMIAILGRINGYKDEG
jgi:hypothetical protein